MPANPLTPEQKVDAAALKARFTAWQAHRKVIGEPWSQAWASAQLGFGQSAINQYINAKIPLNTDVASRFAKLLGIPISNFSPALSREIETMADSLAERFLRGHEEEKRAFNESNVRAIQRRGRVPLISDVQAGNWAEIVDNFAPGEAERWIEPWNSTPGDHAFALEVTGESMTSPYVGALSFPEGTVIIVDPDQHADAGHFVVAKDVVTQKATFKKLMYDGGRWYLKPLNPEYRTVEIDDPAVRVIGRVVEFQPKGGKL